jgi:hypothetical protein
MFDALLRLARNLYARLIRKNPRFEIPQGLTEEQFVWLSAVVRRHTTHLSTDVRVHGSRVSATATAESDLDIAILVDAASFERLVEHFFGRPNPGSAKERTMLHARESGKIQAGEARLRSLRQELERSLGIQVDISVVRRGGPFDVGPYLVLHGGAGGLSDE